MITNKVNKLNNVHGVFDGDIFYPRTNIPSGIIRVLLSAKCNYRCPHCFQEGVSYENQKDLSANFIVRVMEFAKNYYGVKIARLTGGEPLIYPELDILLKNLRKVGIDDIDLTTNGSFLEEKIPILLKNKIRLITVTLNTLNSEKYTKLSGLTINNLPKVLKGIDLAKKSGITININLTALDNLPIDDVFEVIEYSKKNGFVVRICEPTFVIGSSETEKKDHFNAIVKKLKKESKYLFHSRCESVDYITFDDKSRITIMYNLCDNRFCSSCAKYLYMRLTNESRLKPCLSRSDTEVQIPDDPTNDELHKCFCIAIANMGNGLKKEKPGLRVK